MNLRDKRIAWLGLFAIALTALLALPISPGLDSARAGTRAVEGTIESALAVTAVTIDGDGSDAAWTDATALTVTAGSVDIDVKTVYTSTDIYFLATWSDPTESVMRKQWSYDAPSDEWTRSGESEDRLSLVWNINVANFNDQGGLGMCHPPDMRTNALDDVVDVWHWKSTRTNPAGWLDDKYWNFTGRHSDSKTSGGYSDNLQTLDYTDDPPNSADVPAYWEPGATGDDAYSILQSEIDAGEAFAIVEVHTNGTLLDDAGTWVSNTTVMPGYYTTKPVGSRGDVDTMGTYSAGEWTLEWMRDLETGNSDDVQFTDTSAAAEYFFGLAVFDNTGGASHETSGADVFRLIFEQPNQAPSTPTVTATPETAGIDEDITFEASATDPDGDTLTYTWDFDDGDAGSGASTTHAFAQAGTFTVTVTVSDGNGGSSQGSVDVTITEPEEAPAFPMELIYGLIIAIIIIVAIVAIVMAKRRKTPPVE
jgi:hypothetical protein